MNYLKQILAFEEQTSYMPLAHSQIILYYKLLYINNRLGWTEWFTVTSGVLSAMTNLPRSTINNARQKLKSLGYIDFKTDGQNVTAYKVNELSVSWQSQIVDTKTFIDNKKTLSGQNVVAKSSEDGQSVSALNKLNKTKLNNISSSSIDNNINIYSEPAPATTENDYQKAIAFYEQHFGIASPIINESLLQWVDDLGIQLVKEAISRSVKTNKSYRYAEAIMRSWTKKGVDTLEKAKAEQVAFDNSRTNRYKQQKTVTLSDQERDELNAVDTPLSAEELAELKAMMN